MDILEVSENGTLTLPAEVLRGVKPHTRFRLEIRDEGLLLRAEEESVPLNPDEWWTEFEALSESISRAWKSDKSAVEIISEMRR